MKKYKHIIIGGNLLLVLLFFNFTVFQKERILADGTLLLLELAPVDPRSLMQGDYMALNYTISNPILRDEMEKRGYVVVKADSEGVARLVRVQNETTPLNQDEYLIKYFSPNAWDIYIGAESFFFQEGQGQKYEQARYGGLKVDRQGNSLLVGLFDENKEKIE